MPKEDTDAYIYNCLPNSPQLYGMARAKAFGTRTVIEEEGNLLNPASKLTFSPVPITISIVFRANPRLGEQ